MLKHSKPITPSTRFLVQVDTKKYITATEPFKDLTSHLKSSNGRDSFGHISCRHKSGGHKKLYRHISFKRKFFGDAVVKTVEYDPNRTAFIALIQFADGEKRYIIAPNGLKVGDVVLSGKSALPNVGHTMFLSDIPLGTVIHNIELKPGA